VDYDAQATGGQSQKLGRISARAVPPWLELADVLEAGAINP
jgi:hypothetical protein